jgi:glyoxylase-like metal-dependent hydrolase (beta-lactamase superfamily II)
LDCSDLADFTTSFFIIRATNVSFFRRPEMTYPVDMSITPEVSAHFDTATNTISYIVKDPDSLHCAIIDSVMDIDYAAVRITYDHADALIAEIRSRGLTLDWIIETHVHADHLSAAPHIQKKLGGKIGVGAKILIVQDIFGKVSNEGPEFQRDGSQFDALFEDADTYWIGTMQAFAMYTPGHTPACMVHVMGDTAFVGDTLFMPDGVPGFCMTVFKRCWYCLMPCGCSCATIKPPMAAIFSGKLTFVRKKHTISVSVSVSVHRVRTLSGFGPSGTRSWICQN